MSKSDELAAFESALAADPLDWTTRLVYADWLAENDAEREGRPADAPDVEGREEMLRDRTDGEGDHR